MPQLTICRVILLCLALAPFEMWVNIFVKALPCLGSMSYYQLYLLPMPWTQTTTLQGQRNLDISSYGKGLRGDTFSSIKSAPIKWYIQIWVNIRIFIHICRSKRSDICSKLANSIALFKFQNDISKNISRKINTVKLHYSRKMVDPKFNTNFDFCVVQGNYL